MQDLLLNHQLFSKYDFQTRELAEARTVAALSKLDPKRKGIVVQFLRNSGLIGYLGMDNNRYPAIISLKRADLTNADLTGTFLEYADFSSDNLTSVNLTNADLYRANLSEANLTNADLLLTHLSGAIFVKAKLSGAYLSSVDLSTSQLSATLKRADLSRGNAHLFQDGLKGADLSGAYLALATLTNVDLSGAKLSGAEIFGVDLSGATLGCYSASGRDYCADLTNADLSGANLKGVTGITVEQLEKQVKSLKGATMPDGSTHS